MDKTVRDQTVGDKTVRHQTVGDKTGQIDKQKRKKKKKGQNRKRQNNIIGRTRLDKKVF